jgi:hypothetical protein
LPSIPVGRTELSGDLGRNSHQSLHVFSLEGRESRLVERIAFEVEAVGRSPPRLSGTSCGY